MPDLMKPGNMFVDDSRLYVTENVHVYIYSLKDFKMIRKFGQHGEGPGEFVLDPNMLGLHISRQDGEIMVHSHGKLSWFGMDGGFRRQIATPIQYLMFVQALGKHISARRLISGKKRWQVITIYDKKLKPVKEICRVKHLYQPGYGTDPLSMLPPAAVDKGLIYVIPDDSFTIQVFDKQGKAVSIIKRDEKRKAVTAKDRREIINYFKNGVLTKDSFHIMKPFHFPSHFPAIRNMAVGDGKIFVVTNRIDAENRNECLVLDLKGTLLKRTFVAMAETDLLEFSKFVFHKGSVYELVEDEENEDWRLRITPVL